MARQMEKAELENAEIAGKNTVKFMITKRIYVVGKIDEQVMTINLTLKLREQEVTMLEVEKKVAKKAKRKRKRGQVLSTYLLVSQRPSSDSSSSRTWRLPSSSRITSRSRQSGPQSSSSS